MTRDSSTVVEQSTYNPEIVGLNPATVDTGCQFHQFITSSFFVRKFFCTAFMCLQFGFVIFWQKDFGAKAAHKMLVKVSPGPYVIRLFKDIFYEFS